jgi:hypothetical protein
VRGGHGLEINGHVLARAPVVPIDFSDPVQREWHDRIVAASHDDARSNALVEELYFRRGLAAGDILANEPNV